MLAQLVANRRQQVQGQAGLRNPHEIRVGPVRVAPDGHLTQYWRHVKHGSGTWRLDEATLKPIGRAPRRAVLPRALARPETDFPGIQVLWRSDLGAAGEPGVSYRLRWETLGPNRDRPRRGKLPPASMLRVYKLREGAARMGR